MCLSVVLVAGALGLYFTLQAPTARAGFTFIRSITIDHTKVPNTDQTNFPVLISGTYSYLATVANGGKVQSSSGFDIGFYTGSDCSTGKMSWETEMYTASSGKVIYWVNVSTVSHTSDTVFYLCYGNSSISTDQSNKTGVWDSNYQMVQHWPDGTTLSSNDSTSKGITGTIGSTVTATSSAEIDGGAHFPGSATTDKIGFGNVMKSMTTFTLEGWVNPHGFTTSSFAPIIEVGNGSALKKGLEMNDASGTAQYDILGRVATSTGVAVVQSGSAHELTPDAWNFVTMTYNDNTDRIMYLYINGVNVASSTPLTGTMADDSAAANTWASAETPSNQFYKFGGDMDEIRVSSTARTADWIATEYNNVSSPSTFYTIGSEQNSPLPTTKGVTIKNAKVCVGGCSTISSPAALLAATSAGCGSQPCTITTNAIDATGATLLVAVVSDFAQTASSNTPSDSGGNTWHVINHYPAAAGGGNGNIALWYAYDKSGSPLSVSSSQTVTVSGNFAGITLMVFSGTLTGSDPYDGNQNGNSGTDPLATGSITPSQSYELLVTGFAGNLTGASINSGFTIPSGATCGFFTGIGACNGEGVSGAYITQKAAAAVNPTWTASNGPITSAVAIAAFKVPTISLGAKVCVGLGCMSTIAFVNADRGETTSVVSSIGTTGTSTVSGNLIYAHCASDNGNPGTVTVTDTAANTYTQIGSTLNNGDNLVYSAQFYAKNITGNANDVVTCHFTNSRSFVAVSMMQFSGVDTSNPVDTIATGVATSATSVTSGSFSYGVGDVIAAGTNNGTDSGSHTAGTGYTMPTTGQLSGAEYKLSSATTASAGYSGSRSNLNIMVATFKPLIK